MAVADAALPSPPLPPPSPPARIVVVVLALVHFAVAAMLALGRVLCVAAEALPCLWLAVVWITSAASAAKVVARRAWGEGSASFLFLQTLTYGGFTVLVCGFLALLALGVLLLCGLGVAYVIAAVRGSHSRHEFKERAVGAIKPDPAAGSFSLPRTAVLGFMADVPFMLLVVAGLLIAAVSHVEGSVSQGEMVGLVIVDVGTFAMHAISCSVIIPAIALGAWREDQADRKAPSQFC